LIYTAPKALDPLSRYHQAKHSQHPSRDRSELQDPSQGLCHDFHRPFVIWTRNHQSKIPRPNNDSLYHGRIGPKFDQPLPRKCQKSEHYPRHDHQGLMCLKRKDRVSGTPGDLQCDQTGEHGASNQSQHDQALVFSIGRLLGSKIRNERVRRRAPSKRQLCLLAGKPIFCYTQRYLITIN
jgi:hypothetical protein